LPLEVRRADSYWVIAYRAMAGPCEILTRCKTASEADQLASLAFHETARIEAKFSRYRDESIVQQINRSAGARVAVDEEMSQLLHYAAECHRLSDGRFDITSGVLRRAWTFDGRVVIPDQALISSLLEIVGWDKVEFDGAGITMRPGMEIDLGGLGKEYAVDRVAHLLFTGSSEPVMVNFGGDIRAVSPESGAEPWHVGIEEPGSDHKALGELTLSVGAIATSGDARRFCIVNGRRLGHILDPRTGWPVEDAPRSATVVADFCLEAGFHSTLAMLHGGGAETYLAAQGLKYHCVR
jgi:thiamine biosynthesis lipoprotein